MDDKVYVFEGKTTNEAIEKGLKELKVSKNKVDVKVLESDKRSFFSILEPRVVKVEMKLKEGVVKEEIHHEKEIKSEEENLDSLKDFLDNFVKNLPIDNTSYTINRDGNIIEIVIKGKDVNYLIGYRGESLNSLQNILNNVVNKNSEEKLKVVLNIGDFREKRKKDLEILAVKIANSAIKSGKSITLEPMSAYDRKIIHTKLQEFEKITTYSVGEEPHRKVVVDLK